MLLRHDLVNLKIRRPQILVSDADQRNIREVVIHFHHQRPLHRDPRRSQRMRRNLHPLPPPQLSRRLQNLRRPKVRHELQICPLVNNVVTARRRSHARLVERQTLAVFQQRRLQKSRSQNLKLRLAGRHHNRAAAPHLHLNIGRPRRRNFRLRRRLAAAEHHPGNSSNRTHKNAREEPRRCGPAVTLNLLHISLGLRSSCNESNHNLS